MQGLLYSGLRYLWMGDDNANSQAKEYFVAAMVVKAPIKFLTIGFHPENIVVRPLIYLQKQIYRKGVVFCQEVMESVRYGNWYSFLRRYIKRDRNHQG